MQTVRSELARFYTSGSVEVGPPEVAHGHELWPAHASGRSERRRAGCASGRRTCAAGGERGARLVGGPRGGALGGRSAGRGSAGNASAPASVDYPAREEASTHEGRGGGGASQGAAHLELLSSKLAFPRRAARSTRVVVTRRARLRGGQAQGWHDERGCARRGVRGPRAHPPDLARRVPHMRSATGCSAPEGPAPLRLRRAVPRPGAHAARRGDSRPPHNSQLTTLDSPPSQLTTLNSPLRRTDSPIGPSVPRHATKLWDLRSEI